MSPTPFTLFRIPRVDGIRNSMALIRTARAFALLRHFCATGASLPPSACAVSAVARQTTTEAHTSGRVKLDFQESNAFDTMTSTIKELPMRYYYNRNPRSPELLGVAEKPRGFATTKRRVDYYHRLMLDISSRHVSAYVNHNNGSKVMEASTKEFCISRHLYKRSDVAAALNVGRVIATRCKEAGLTRVMWQHTKNRNRPKVVAFIKGVLLEGLILNEPKPRKRLPMPGTLPKH